MKEKKMHYKERRKLSFKSRTLDLIRAEEEGKALDWSDAGEFYRLSREYLEDHTLPEDREVGRRIGLDAATTLPKDLLIDAILDRLWGIQYFSDPRPVLNPVVPEDLTAEDELTMLENIRRGDFLLGETVEGVYESTLTGGIVRVKRFVKNERDVCVVRNLAGEYALQDGDLIKGRAVYLQSVGFFCLHFIELLNGAPAKKSTVNTMPQDELSEAEAEPESENTAQQDSRLSCPNKRLPLSAEGGLPLLQFTDVFAPVCKGQFAVFSCDVPYDFTALAIELAHNLKFSETVDEVVFLALAEPKHRAMQLSRIYSEAVLTAADEPMHENVAIVMRAAAYAARAAENGKHVVVVLSNMTKLIGNEALFSAVSRACAYRDGGSATFIMGADRENPNSAYYAVKERIDAECRIWRDGFSGRCAVELRNSFSNGNFERDEAETALLDAVRAYYDRHGEQKTYRLLGEAKSVGDIKAALDAS